MKSILIISIALVISFPLFSQDIIEFRNPSLEGEAQRGLVSNSQNLKYWIDCSSLLNLGESSFDIHSADSDIWDVNQKPSDGSSFIGLVMRQTNKYESMTQRLDKELSKNNCYSFKIDLSVSEFYVSGVKGLIAKVNFDGKSTLKVSGGSVPCKMSQTLHQTKVINHNEWKTYDIQFKAKKDISYIVLSAYWKTPALYPYDGHILIDNLQPIHQIDCSTIDQD